MEIRISHLLFFTLGAWFGAAFALVDVYTRMLRWLP